jgi:hypothetical protein
MRKTLLALTLLSLSVSTGAIPTEALAQGQRGTADEQKACTRDAQKHCRAVLDQGDLVVLSCLQQNRSKISPACDAVLKSHGQ